MPLPNNDDLYFGDRLKPMSELTDEQRVRVARMLHDEYLPAADARMEERDQAALSRILGEIKESTSNRSNTERILEEAGVLQRIPAVAAAPVTRWGRIREWLVRFLLPAHLIIYNVPSTAEKIILDKEGLNTLISEIWADREITERQSLFSPTAVDILQMEDIEVPDDEIVTFLTRFEGRKSLRDKVLKAKLAKRERLGAGEEN